MKNIKFVFSPLLTLAVCSVSEAGTMTFTSIDVSGVGMHDTVIHGIDDSYPGDTVMSSVTGSGRRVNFEAVAGPTGYIFLDPYIPNAGLGTIEVHDINNAHQIVGSYHDNQGQWIGNQYVESDKGFLFQTLGGPFTKIEYPEPYFPRHTDANGINDRGQIVGDYTHWDEISGVGQERGFLREANGHYVDIAYGITEIYTSLEGINNSGQIVGHSWFGSVAHGYWGGFVRDAQSNFSGIYVPGSTATWANGINDSGEIVGNYGDGITTHGFLYDPYFDSYQTIDFPGASGTHLAAINNAGTMVGSYRDKNGVHGLVITVPESAPAAYFGIGFLMIYLRRALQCALCKKRSK